MGSISLLIGCIQRSAAPHTKLKWVLIAIRELKAKKPELMVECLSPDFAGSEACVQEVCISLFSLPPSPLSLFLSCGVEKGKAIHRKDTQPVKIFTVGPFVSI